MPFARLLLAVTVISTAFVLSTPTAGACSCDAGTDQQFFDRADAVFEGTVLDVEQIGYLLAVATFEVGGVYKGSVRDTQLIYTHAQESACGIGVTVGLDYVVFADVIDGSETDPGYPIGDLRAGLCGGRRPATAEGLDLDPPVEPVAPIADAPTTTTTLLRPTTGAEAVAEPLTGGGVLVVGFIAVGVIGAFIAARLARHSREP